MKTTYPAEESRLPPRPCWGTPRASLKFAKRRFNSSLGMPPGKLCGRVEVSVVAIREWLSVRCGQRKRGDA